MLRIIRYIFIFTLIFSTYHTIRDVLQILGVHHWSIDILAEHKHNWCKPLCDYYTIPWDIFVVVGSFIVLKRGKVDLLGKALLFAFIIWPVIWIINWLLG